MVKIISLFNHKGGVSKTTTVFHLAWKIAQLGKKVLMVDADPQCNLTGLTLGINNYEELYNFYDSRQNADIYHGLRDVFFDERGNSQVKWVSPTPVPKNPNLFLLAGHVKFAELDPQLATAMTTWSAIPKIKSLIGSIYELINLTAQQGDFDIVLIDMSPSIAATNRCIFMGSDYFIIPTSPDFFCYQAIDSLTEVLPNWAEEFVPFKNGILLPRNNPKMLGIITQNYRVYGNKDDDSDTQKNMAKAFQDWADRIRKITNSRLVPELYKKNMIIDQHLFQNIITYDAPYNLANVQNFNSLISYSQDHRIPMYELKQEHCKNSQGAVWERTQNGKETGMKFNIQECDVVYSRLAQSVLELIK